MTLTRRCLLAVAVLSIFAVSPPATLAQDSMPPPKAQAATPARKRPLAAGLEGLALNVMLNRVDAWVTNVCNPREGCWARVGPGTWSRNIRFGWDWDGDDFQTNMFLHPYHGAAYFRAGRANGLDFWESTPLTFLGSLEWEYFGETNRPALNDLYNTSFGGIVLGEVTHRLLSLIRDNRARGLSRVFRELAAVPIDPPGSIKRLLAGDARRVYANPADRDPGAFGVRLQGGPQIGADSAVAGRRNASGTLLADITYGDPFARPYRAPFDVFQVRLRASSGPHVVTEMRVEGRLYGHEITFPEADMRWIFTLNQKIEYDANPAYKYGGQSLDLGFVSGIVVKRGIDLQGALYGEGILLGAVDAPGAGIAGSLRTYDFGPGLGFDLAASLRVKTFPVVSARWHWAYLHSVSGSSADHYTQFPSIEVTVPLTPSLGVGAYAGWYHRRSDYAGRPGETTFYPEYRAYLVWQTHRGPLPPEPQ